MAAASGPQESVDDDLEYCGDLQAILKETKALRMLLGSEYQEIAHADFDFEAYEGAPGIGQRSAPAPLSEQIRLVERALESNRGLQHRLRRLLTSVERAQDKAVGIRDRVQAVVRRRHSAASAPRSHAGRKHHQEYTGSSWFWSIPDAPCLPQYPDSADVLSVTSNLPLVFRRAVWSEDERCALREGVLQIVQERKLNDILSDMESAAAARPGGAGNSALAEFEARQAPIRALCVEHPDVEITAKNFSNTEWDAVAHRCVPDRTAIECKLQWQNEARPRLRFEPFTPDEDSQLNVLVQQHGDRAWEKVAAALGDGCRTALTCLSRYQFLEQSKCGPREFNLGELGRLSDLCRIHGTSWKRIAEEFGGGWDADQLMHVWRRHEQRTQGGLVAAKVGKWVCEEDELLLKGVALHGRKWSLIAKLVPGRTDVQCRERYMNVLNPEVKNKSAFTPEEDSLLHAVVPLCTSAATGAISWALVAKQLPGRTDRQCGKRWKALNTSQSRGAGDECERECEDPHRSVDGAAAATRRRSTHAQARPSLASSKKCASSAKRGRPRKNTESDRKQANSDDEAMEEIEEVARSNSRGRMLKKPSRFL